MAGLLEMFEEPFVSEGVDNSTHPSTFTGSSTLFPVGSGFREEKAGGLRCINDVYQWSGRLAKLPAWQVLTRQVMHPKSGMAGGLPVASPLM